MLIMNLCLSNCAVTLRPPWAITTAFMFLELLVAFVQAYVFVILITTYINDVINSH